MGVSEIFLIMAIALLLFGPEDLPDIARTIGKIVFEIRKATHELTREFQNSMDTPHNNSQKTYDQTTSSRTKEPEINAALSKAEVSVADEKLLKYDDESSEDPLAGLPLDMVTYEKKGASR